MKLLEFGSVTAKLTAIRTTNLTKYIYFIQMFKENNSLMKFLEPISAKKSEVTVSSDWLPDSPLGWKRVGYLIAAEVTANRTLSIKREGIPKHSLQKRLQKWPNPICLFAEEENGFPIVGDPDLRIHKVVIVAEM